ncbi:MAG TPA: TetR/AcrR family transcriptional regulator [Trebonia sp.]|jgi:AcrR family transcriptional regulator|nr:TetR/AcrR family transcriptional regulator [Trebonia sp.]
MSEAGAPSLAAGEHAARGEQARDKILAAAGELMMQGDLSAVTMEAIAARAGVSKRTLYKYWPSRGAVALEGFMRRAATSWTVPAGASAPQALEALVVAAARLFAQTPAGPLMRSLIADAQSQQEIADALRDQWLRPRRAVAADLIAAGIAAGELRADLDMEIALDLLFAPVYYRLLLGHEPLDVGFAAALARAVIGGLSRPGGQPPGR